MASFSSYLSRVVPTTLKTRLKAWLHRYVRSIVRDIETAKRQDWTNHPQIKIGRNTYGIEHDTIPIMGCPNWSLEVGSFCSIAPGVKLVFGIHRMNCATTFPIREYIRNDWRTDLWPPETIRIGHDVWIASNALVLSGVTIGHGAIIGAGAVVSRDIPPYAIAAGVPARVVRTRMSPENIEKMLAIGWWDWPIERILANEHLLYGDLEAFITTFWPPKPNVPAV